MSRNTIPIDLDREVIDRLLVKLEQRTLTREEAKELQRRLEIRRRNELARGNINLANKITYILIGLNGYIAGSINIQEPPPPIISTLGNLQ
jgi:hypothetical protein